MNELKIVKGNTFSTAIKVRAYTYDGEEITDFDLNLCTTIKVYVHINESKTAIRRANYGVLQDNYLRINWPAEDLLLGKYALEVVGVYNNVDWRFYDKREIFEIVNTNAEANIPKESIIYDGFYSIGDEGVRFISNITNVHIDYVGEDNYVYKWDDTLNQYVKSDIYVKGADAIIEDGSIAYQKLDDTLQSYMDKISNNVYEIHANKVTSISNTSTDSEYPSARAVYAYVRNKQSAITIEVPTISGTTFTALPNKIYDLVVLNLNLTITLPHFQSETVYDKISFFVDTNGYNIAFDTVDPHIIIYEDLLGALSAGGLLKIECEFTGYLYLITTTKYTAYFPNT